MSSERFAFLPTPLPPEVKLMSKSIATVHKSTLQYILQAVAAVLSGKQPDKDLLTSLTNGNKASFTNINIVIAGLFTIVRAALRLPAHTLKRETVSEDLQQLNLPAEFATDVTELLYGPGRSQLENIRSRPSLNVLNNLRWRVDVSIATSALNRILEPTIVMEFSLSNGTRKTFEVSVKTFHQLRFNVAKVLKEMEMLQQRTVLHIKE